MTWWEYIFFVDKSIWIHFSFREFSTESRFLTLFVGQSRLNTGHRQTTTCFPAQSSSHLSPGAWYVNQSIIFHLDYTKNQLSLNMPSMLTSKPTLTGPKQFKMEVAVKPAVKLWNSAEFTIHAPIHSFRRRILCQTSVIISSVLFFMNFPFDIAMLTLIERRLPWPLYCHLEALTNPWPWSSGPSPHNDQFILLKIICVFRTFGEQHSAFIFVHKLLILVGQFMAIYCKVAQCWNRSPFSPFAKT